mgnify:FL=1
MNENSRKHLKKPEPAPKAPSRTARSRHDGAAAAPKKKAAAKPAETDAKAAKPPRPRKPKKSHKGLIITLVVVSVLLAAIAVGLILWADSVTASDTNLPGVYVGSTNVGGLTEKETLELLKGQQWDKSVSGTMTVQLPAEQSFRIDYIRSGAVLTAESAAAAAYRYGHGSNKFDNLKTYISSLMTPVDITEGDKSLNRDYIMALVTRALERFDKHIGDGSYTVDEAASEMVYIKGAGQIKLDAEDVYAKAVEGLKALESSISYALPAQDVTAPDFNALHTELMREPHDAYYDKETGEIVPDVKGFAFDVSEAESLWNAAGLLEEVRIPVKIDMPEMTAEQLVASLFRDKLGSQTTLYTYSSDARINNIKLCAAKLNGLVLNPGEEFSFNGTIGQRTTEAGFKAAAAYNDGQVVQEVGGGICQVSSTIYCAAMLAQMTTVERTCHMFVVTYLPYGLDATVSWPGPDYKFRNDRDYPVKIVAYCNDADKSITIEIWGTDVDGSYVELTSGYGYRYDSTYPDVVIGYSAVSYRNIYDKDGNLIDRVFEASSSYDLHEDEIKWPEPSESPTPSDTGTIEPSTEPSAPTEPSPDPTIIIVEGDGNG